MYRALRWALFLVAPERIHTWVFAFLRAVTAVLPVRRVLAGWLAPLWAWRQALKLFR